jgi:hypothetical protein
VRRRISARVDGGKRADRQAFADGERGPPSLRAEILKNVVRIRNVRGSVPSARHRDEGRMNFHGENF